MDKAKDTYKEVQKTIWRGEQLELYADVQRLLPDHIKPDCLEMKMDIQEYVREDGRKKSISKGDSPEKGKKRKRNDDIGRNIPAGASTGFVSVAKLLVKGASKKRKKIGNSEDFDLAGQDDDTDMDIESGAVLALPRRTVSTSATTTSKSSTTKAKTKLRKAATMDGTKEASTAKKKKEGRKRPQPEPRLSQLGMDDSDDMEIEQGIGLTRSRSHKRITQSPGYPSSPDIPIAATIIDLVSSDSDQPLSRSTRRTKESSPAQPAKLISSGSSRNSFNAVSLCANMGSIDLLIDRSEHHSSVSPCKEFEDEGQSIAWLVDDDDELDLEIVNSSPVAGEDRRLPAHPITGDESVEFVEDLPNARSPLKSNKYSGHLDQPESSCSRHRLPEPDESIEFLDSLRHSSPLILSPKSSPAWQLSSSPPPKSQGDGYSFNMPPPDLPARIVASSPASFQDQEDPELSFPVRAVRNPTKRSVDCANLDSPLLDMPPPSRRRLHRLRESSPVRHPKSKRKVTRPAVSPKLNPWIDIEAAHSGDDLSEGSSHADEDVESESDQLFLQEPPETQVSPSYDQTAAYRQSLLTHPPARGKVPTFANRPVRRGAFGAGQTSSSRPRPIVSSSPGEEGPDEYAMGSFVVHDDAEISYIGNSSGFSDL